MSDQLAPEVLSLLKVALADDSSALRKIRSLSAKQILDAPLSPRTTFLTQEERHLLTHHREELGRLLYEGCMLTLQGPVEETKAILSCERVDRNEWDCERTAILHSTDRRWPDEKNTLHLPPGAQGLDSRAARIALALWPVDATRNVLADLLRLEGEFAGSEHIARTVVDSAPAPHHRATALTVLGALSHTQGAHARALTCYAEASRTEPTFPAPPVFWFVQALMLGSEADALRAAQVIHQRSEMIRPSLPALLEILAAERATGALAIVEELRAKLLKQDPEELEARLLDVL